MLNLEAQGLEPKIDHKIDSPYQIPFFVHKDNFWIIFSQQVYFNILTNRIWWPLLQHTLWKEFLEETAGTTSHNMFIISLVSANYCVAQRFWWNMIYIFKMNFITPSNVCLSLIHHYIHLHVHTITRLSWQKSTIV